MLKSQLKHKRFFVKQIKNLTLLVMEFVLVVIGKFLKK